MNTFNMLDIPVHDMGKFSYNKDDKTFVAETSDLNIPPGRFHGCLCDQVWNDACDEGFWIESNVTGVKKLFTFEGIDTMPDGDGGSEIAGWRFNCYGQGGVLEFKALIIND